MNVTRWWVVVVGAAGTALVFAWLGRLAGVTPGTLWTIGAAFAALTWTAVLVTVPWNVYFGARRVATEQAASTDRGIEVRPERAAEARRIARWMLRFAIGGHLLTAAVTAVAARVTGAAVGYWLTGFFLLSTVLRPASAYFSHLRQRIGALEREALYPRDDVVSLRAQVAELTQDLAALRAQTDQRLTGVDDDLRRAVADTAHVRTLVSTDLARIETTARTATDDLSRRLDRLAHQVTAALDGVSDHHELVTGLRALVRMIRAE